MKSNVLYCLILLCSVTYDAQAQKICTELSAKDDSQGGNLTSHGAYLTQLHKCKWEKNVITVKFLDGEQTVKEKVEKYAAEWSKYANIKFSFIQSGDADIRISFKNSGSWSCLGNCPCEVNGKNPTQNEPTMNFGWLTSNSPDYEYSRVVLHEFGHALGFTHEHQSPDSDIPWDRNAVIEYYSRSQGWSEEETGRNIFSKYGKDETNFSSYDENSIMHYAIPDELTVGDFSTRWNTEFSPTDKKYASIFYPCSDNRARNYGKGEKCRYGYFFGHKNQTPGVKYVWPSPWNSDGYVWCHIPNHQMSLSHYSLHPHKTNSQAKKRIKAAGLPFPADN